MAYVTTMPTPNNATLPVSSNGSTANDQGNPAANPHSRTRRRPQRSDHTDASAVHGIITKPPSTPTNRIRFFGCPRSVRA